MEWLFHSRLNALGIQLKEEKTEENFNMKEVIMVCVTVSLRNQHDDAWKKDFKSMACR